MAARVGSARRRATNAMLASVMGLSLAPSGARMFHGSSNRNTLGRGLAPWRRTAHRLLSFERDSISRFVIRTSPRTWVHSETMLPTTCPHLDSESIPR